MTMCLIHTMLSDIQNPTSVTSVDGMKKLTYVANVYVKNPLKTNEQLAQEQVKWDSQRPIPREQRLKNVSFQ